MRYLSTLRFSDDWMAALRVALPDVVVTQISATRAADVPAEVWAETDVLHTSSVFPEPADVPRLRWVQLDTAGVDHVVGHAIWSAPVHITTIGGISPVPTAEYVMLMVLAFSHHLPALVVGQRAHEWPTPEGRWHRYLPRRIEGATLGVVGYGRIGREVGRRAQAFGMSVIGVRSGHTVGSEHDGGPDVVAVGNGGGTPVVAVKHLGTVLPRCDYVVVSVPLTAETRGLLGERELGQMKQGAVLINVARGGVIDEDAVLGALEQGRLGGAAFDVFACEPLPAHSPLWDHPLVIVTPHVAGFAPGYERATLELVTTNLRRFIAGEPLVNLVDRARGY